MAPRRAPDLVHDRNGRSQRWRPSWVRPFRGSPDWWLDTLAVTPVIGAIMILAISAMGVGSVLVWGLPSIQDTQSNTEFEGVLYEFEAFDQIVTNVLHGGSPGKASKGVLNIPGGQIIRSDGNWMAVAWYPINTLSSGSHLNTTFYVEGYDAADPTTLTLTNRGVTVSDVDVRLETVFDKIHVTRVLQSATTWTVNTTVTVTVGDPEELKAYPTRLKVSDQATSETIFEMWMFPLGALEHRRETSQGPLKVILENGAVLTQRLDTSAIRDKPLATKENRTDAPAEPSLVALFVQLFTDNATSPGVSAGGSGSWPLLFSLKSNNLRANSTEVQRVALNLSGERHETWMRYYIDNYGFVRQDGAGAAGNLDGGAELIAGPTYDDFRFVLMESLIEIMLLSDRDDVTQRPPPPALGSPGGGGGGGGGGGICIPGKGGNACTWGSTKVK